MDKEKTKKLGFVKIDFHEITNIIGYDKIIENASHNVFMKEEIFKGLFCHKENQDLILAFHWDRGHKIYLGELNEKQKKLNKIIEMDFDSDSEIIYQVIEIIVNKYKK